MRIFEAGKSDAEELVDGLWISLAREMEDLSGFNRLAESDVRSNAVKYFTDRLRKDEHRFFVAEEDDKFVGFVGLEERTARPVFDREKFVHIHELYVRKEYRRQGIASDLLEKVEEFSREEKFDMIRLAVNVRNRSAIELYEKRGYEKERAMMIKGLN